MSLTTKEQTALNSLSHFIPAMAADQTDGVSMLLGDQIAAAQTGVPQSAVPALKVAAVASVVANGAPTAVADATGDVGAGALANDLKAKYNALVTLVNDLKVQHNLLANGIDALP